MTKEVTIGDVLIAGGAQAKKTPSKERPDGDVPKGAPSGPDKYFEPIYKLGSTYSYNAYYIACALAILLAIYALYANWGLIMSLKSSRPGLIKTIAKQGLTIRLCID